MTRANPLFKEIVQIGLVVKSVEATAEKYWQDFGIGPWTFYAFDSSNVRDMTVHGKRVDHAWRAGAANIGNIQLEIMEPLDDSSIYAEHLRTRGEGIHHIQFSVDSYNAAKTHICERGYRELGSGILCGIRYNYFDTEGSLGFIAEIISPRDGERELALPDGTYP